MAAKQSAEMRHALHLVASGRSVYDAAAIARVYPSSIYKAMKNKDKKKVKKKVALYKA
jgi:hypothetical protein